MLTVHSALAPPGGAGNSIHCRMPRPRLLHAQFQPLKRMSGGLLATVYSGGRRWDAP